MYKPGQLVRIIHDSYPGGRNFVGQIGTVRTPCPDGATVTGLDPDSDQSYRFHSEEIEPA